MNIKSGLKIRISSIVIIKIITKIAITSHAYPHIVLSKQLAPAETNK